jgi:hypothetical protein
MSTLSGGQNLNLVFVEKQIRIEQSLRLAKLILADFLYDSQGFFNVLGRV